MKFGRTIVTGLYLLLMVVLPHWHLVLDRHVCDSSEPTSSHHDSCSLCKILNTPAQTSDAAILVQVAFLPPEIVSFTDRTSENPTEPPQQARAPPFMTA